MAILFKEIRNYLQRNVRLSICFEGGNYHNYLMISDISDEKYNELYVYGVGLVDVEFPKDVYTPAKESAIKSTKDVIIEPAIEIVLHEAARDIERKSEGALRLKDLKPYLEIDRNFAIVNVEDWQYDLFEYRDDIPSDFDEKFVYGIGMEDDENNKSFKEVLKRMNHDSCLKKRMVIVLSDKARTDITAV